MGINAINQTIVQRHAEDAAFLWLLRDRAILSSRYSHRQMQALDDRVDAHLDGLRIAGAFAWECCVAQLEGWGEPDELFAAAALAFDTDDGSRWAIVLDRACGPHEYWRALVAASGWYPRAKVEPRLRAWWGSTEPDLRSLGLGGLLAHRVDTGQSLTSVLERGPDRLVELAIRSAGDLGRADLKGVLRAYLDTPKHRVTAAVALARLGVDETPVLETLLAAAESADEAAGEAAIESLVWLSPDLGRDCYRRWRSCASGRGRAIHAAVALGSPRVVDDLLEWMRDDDFSRLSGRAFSAILGVDLEYDDLDRDAPPRGAGDEDGEVRVEDPRVDGLPWPSVFAAAQWWRAHRERFDPGLCYLTGEPVGAADGSSPSAIAHESLLSLAKRGRPWWRALAARRLAHTQEHLPLIQTQAPTGKLHELPGLAAWSMFRVHSGREVQDVG